MTPPTAQQLPQPAATPVLPLQTGAVRPLSINDVLITGGFWARAQHVNAVATLPHAAGWIERLGWIDNFTPTPGRERTGRLFTDSDVYKLLEAQCWEYGRTADEALNRRIKDNTAAIANSLEPDGYLNTYYGSAGPGDRYTDFGQGHELYCYGHLIQAAVARLRTTGSDELTDLGRRVADHISALFGEHGEPSICGHPGVEMALVELYRATGEQRYLRAAQEQIQRRGHGSLGPGSFGAAYYQDDEPVLQATVLRGHAVRALYLACGAVDVATETGDHALLAAVITQWDATLARRTYVTGGMGSRASEESFGDDFELPADSAYAETCAGVALIMLGWRLLLATGDSRYADMMEHLFYNIVATSVAEDGQSFFYANTLHRRTPLLPVDPMQVSQDATGGGRQTWYAVPCCPTNLARTFASMSTYLATTTDAGVQLHQYATGTVHTLHRTGAPMALSISTDYPFDGAINIRIDETPPEPWRLTVRIPHWCTEATVTVDGIIQTAGPGVVHLDRQWKRGAEVLVHLAITDNWIEADPRVDAVRGQTALQRGPVVYCAEALTGIEDPVDLDLVAVVGTPATVDIDRPTAQGAAARARTVPGIRRQIPDAPGWPYESRPQPRIDPVAIPLIPYYSWDNRGASTMRIWLPKVTAATTTYVEGDTS